MGSPSRTIWRGEGNLGREQNCCFSPPTTRIQPCIIQDGDSMIERHTRTISALKYWRLRYHSYRKCCQKVSIKADMYNLFRINNRCNCPSRHVLRVPGLSTSGIIICLSRTSRLKLVNRFSLGNTCMSLFADFSCFQSNGWVSEVNPKVR